MKCEYSGTECEYASKAHEDDVNDTSMECLAVHPSQCPDSQADIQRIEKLQKDGGHSRHCACRLVWGDGECECGAREDNGQFGVGA